ncbi:fluoride efflux transporter FluC [Neobacillus muris]|uniref:fluoride efflux transporter FluC n=1 Tax=Neobacillus muris TaxID=2941334 RepID=UPI0020414EC6|nr:CrcB family protein [Neobacillus muris]
MSILLVAAGGFIGAIIRFMISRKFNRPKFPAGTFLVNMAGAFLLGFLGGITIPQPIYVLFGTGFMGALTTFSTLHLDAEQLKKTGQMRRSYFYLIFSYFIGIILSFIGVIVGTSI